MENILELITINELQKYKFYIPSYQRGYRWGEKEVKDLLNDISDFMPRLVGDSDEKTWYCLQPIVIKEREDNELEVIDGQQRLTTIYLILHYLNQDFIEAKRDKLFELDYQTRKDSKTFLQNLGGIPNNNENIDYFYISESYQTITNWFEEKGGNFDKGEFRSKFKFNSKVIWYQSYEEDSIAIFTRINIGKIPLTNAELIKALFLNSSNFEKGDLKKLKQKQFEIASEWDNIEHSLQNDRLWYFINQNKVSTNRIELIFDLMNSKKDPTDQYSTFRFFNEIFKHKTQEIIEKKWSEIKQYFQRFNEWFNERDLYHKIGYLLCVEAVKISNLYQYSSILTKKNFKNRLDGIIKENLKNINLSDLQYGDKNIKNILLLYNILTMLNSEKDQSYFPFDIYKNEKWDIEHITSVKDTLPEKNRDSWLKDAIAFIDSSRNDGPSLIERANSCDCDDDENFKKLFEDIVAHFNSELKDDDINDISNLTLLDSETNRGYKNAVFPLKRKTIIKRDKAGVFIPICTKNVFLKYFSDYPPKISFWTQDDRENYEKDLDRVLNGYISN
ncbi:MAG: DUF262 domain-containing protein [Proteobacteria bacterium]|nr:DUF262 domain-containing protein [Pseudomonadota bacterium]MBU1584199.1 DUF262 domain-containing protein [Pseudomonadota bacterium]MBU2452288.1 DUF262 domain-containing protein [Pseudomonadota bacterium]MBU2628037.1 DUF262 domain-containing protein [Pseudomonadota bacterium]